MRACVCLRLLLYEQDSLAGAAPPEDDEEGYVQNRASQHEYDQEAYDDSDLYQNLLKELVQADVFTTTPPCNKSRVASEEFILKLSRRAI